MTDREAMKLALDALENNRYIIESEIHPPEALEEVDVAIAVLRQALEQPECNPHPDAPHGFNRESSHSLGRYVCDCEGWEPEPVAWASIKNGYPDAWIWNPEYVKANPNVQLTLYTAPPKREWQGLTDEEIAEGARQSWVDKQAFESAVWWAESKLREKNGF